MSREGRNGRSGGNEGSAIDRSLREQLFDDEEVVLVARPGRLATLPKLILTLGLYGFWRRRDTAVLTDHRILLGAGILRRRERSIPLAVIEDVSFTRSGLNSYADVMFHDGHRSALRRIGPMAPRHARRLTRETLRRL